MLEPHFAMIGAIFVIGHDGVALAFKSLPHQICAHGFSFLWTLLGCSVSGNGGRFRRGGIARGHLNAIVICQLLSGFTEGAAFHPLNQTNGVDALFVKTLLAGAEDPILPFVVPQRRAAISMGMVFRKGAPSDTLPKLDPIEIACDLGGVGDPALQFQRQSVR